MWQAAGLDVIVSLLTPDEIAELELQEEEACCRAAGLDFHAFPIVDRGVPASRVEVTKLIGKLREALESWNSVGVHCRHGIRRSSMMVAAVLVAAGEEPEEAFRRVATARGRCRILLSRESGCYRWRPRVSPPGFIGSDGSSHQPD